jgi:hypothetical protein
MNGNKLRKSHKPTTYKKSSRCNYVVIRGGIKNSGETHMNFHQNIWENIPTASLHALESLHEYILC